ncbi:hypothetical protein C8J56DRAFT_3255 [Mycena floridula]|nr:hypothetical protein C8J56DRAFT_3255 [Mycena floridula]
MIWTFPGVATFSDHCLFSLWWQSCREAKAMWTLLTAIGTSTRCSHLRSAFGSSSAFATSSQSLSAQRLPPSRPPNKIVGPFGDRKWVIVAFRPETTKLLSFALLETEPSRNTCWSPITMLFQLHPDQCTNNEFVSQDPRRPSSYLIDRHRNTRRAPIKL